MAQKHHHPSAEGDELEGDAFTAESFQDTLLCTTYECKELATIPMVVGGLPTFCQTCWDKRCPGRPPFDNLYDAVAALAPQLTRR